MQLTLPSLPFMAARLFGMPAPMPTRVVRRFSARVPEGATWEIVPPPGVVKVYCRWGEAWITHDGDPRDVMLDEDECYVADTRAPMRVHALRSLCVLEFEVEESDATIAPH